MRELKFRAWIETCEYPDYQPFKGMGYFSIMDFSSCDFGVSTYGEGGYDYPCIDIKDKDGKEYSIYKDDIKVTNIMQYTGLKDKNDKGIYEGDILVAETPYDEDEGEDVLEVKYFKKEACFGVDLSSAEWHYDLSNDAKRFEVVGNIYEDSNLLKK